MSQVEERKIDKKRTQFSKRAELHGERDIG
jgi:hypothetical protein